MAKEEKFRVNPDALRGYATLLERQVVYMRAMQDHVSLAGETKGLQGIMIHWANEAWKLYDWERRKLDEMATKLFATVHGLVDTAELYRKTDEEARAELDKKAQRAPDNHPGPGRGAI